MNIVQFENKINKILSELLEVDIENITSEAHLLDELCMDSLDSIELIMIIEEEFNTEISDEEAEKCRFVKDIYHYLDNKLCLGLYQQSEKPSEARTETSPSDEYDCSSTEGNLSQGDSDNNTEYFPEDILFDKVSELCKDNDLSLMFLPDGEIGVMFNDSDEEYVVKGVEEFEQLISILKQLESFKKF
jgi:acyl carrier protein